MKKRTIALQTASTLFFATFSPEGFSGTINLCQANEHVYFSCHVAKLNKIVSICGSLPESHERDLQYRFGLPHKIEFSYPQSLKHGGDKFYFSEYVRPKVTRQSLRFRNGNYQYAIDVNSDGEEEPPEFNATISVSGPKSVILSCKPRSFKGIDSNISDITKCDSENPLGVSMCSDLK
jgi:hypothetical protein